MVQRFKENEMAAREVSLRRVIRLKGHLVYLQMRVLAQAINVTIKVNDGTRIKEAESSSSQCCPVKPKAQRHSYFRGGWWSRQRPPFWHGWNRHSFSFTQPWLPALSPGGHLRCFLCSRNNNHDYINKSEVYEIRKENKILTLGGSLRTYQALSCGRGRGGV